MRLNNGQKIAKQQRLRIFDGKNNLTMKTKTVALTILALIAVSCGGGQTATEAEFGNAQNPLFGEIYQNITDIPELNEWILRGGSILYTGKNEDGSFRFATENFSDENGNIVIFLVELLPLDEGGRRDRKIIDAIRFEKYNEGYEFMSFVCRINEEHDSEIMAIVVWENEDILKNVIRAWRANTNTGRIEEVDVERVDCWNPRPSS